MRRHLHPNARLSAWLSMTALAVLVGTAVVPSPPSAPTVGATVERAAVGDPWPGEPLLGADAVPSLVAIPTPGTTGREGPRLTSVVAVNVAAPRARVRATDAGAVSRPPVLFGASGADRCRLVCVFRL